MKVVTTTYEKLDPVKELGEFNVGHGLDSNW